MNRLKKKVALASLLSLFVLALGMASAFAYDNEAPQGAQYNSGALEDSSG